MTTIDSDVLARVMAFVDDRADEIVHLAAELIRQPSVNPDLEPNAEAERPAQTWLREQLLTDGTFNTVETWEEVPDRPNTVAVRPGAGDGRSLCWASHIDVVPVTAEQAASWSGAGPFSGEVRDGKLWGRGASDMKSAIAASVMAARVLHQAGIRLAGDLSLAIVSGEESGQRRTGCDAVLERGHRADLAIFPEPSNFAIYPSIKGEAYFTLTVPGRSTHIANRQLVTQALPHGVERPGVSAVDNMLKYQIALLELERRWLLWRTSPRAASGGMFISVNSLHAGPIDAPVPPTAVPDRCVATGSLLFYPDVPAAEVLAEVRAVVDRVTDEDPWLREHPPTLEIPSGHPMKEPVDLPWDHPGVLAIQEATRSVTGQPATVASSPFVCDANYWSERGQPSLIFGVGDPSWGIHGVDEQIPVADLITATKLFAATSIAWCGVSEV